MKNVINYLKIVDESMREIAHKTLKVVESDGLQDNHQLYISFLTKYPGVHLSDRMRARYPEEITIVLQYQYTNLIVEEEKFTVTLSFDGVPETVIVPYKSMISFADPSVKFSIQFTEFLNNDRQFRENTPQNLTNANTIVTKVDSNSSNVVSLDKFRQRK